MIWTLLIFCSSVIADTFTLHVSYVCGCSGVRSQMRLMNMITSEPEAVPILCGNKKKRIIREKWLEKWASKNCLFFKENKRINESREFTTLTCNVSFSAYTVSTVLTNNMGELVWLCTVEEYAVNMPHNEKVGAPKFRIHHWQNTFAFNSPKCNRTVGGQPLHLYTVLLRILPLYASKLVQLHSP